MWRREGEGDVVPLTRFVGGSGQAHLLVYACAHPSESAPTPCATTEEVIDAGDQIRFGAGNVRLKDAPTQGEPLFPLGFAHSSITQYSDHTCGISSVPVLERHSLTYSASHSGRPATGNAAGPYDGCYIPMCMEAAPMHGLHACQTVPVHAYQLPSWHQVGAALYQNQRIWRIALL